ncbi:MAG: HDOD domain-containing protein [Burkholderiales bacterium]|nr:HDOD domain-containing protein [Burkholderiales bacterium]
MNTPETISNGRYRIEGTLGRGAQGTVYLARDTRLERAVALKSVGRGRGAADRAHRLLAEARALGQLNHPHLATVFDALEHDGSHYLVLEYVDGETVDACLRRRGALDRNTAAEIALQVLDGLAHAHDKNIIHRDVKPSNVVIDRSGKARLIDFGIAVAEGTRNALSGTPQYAAPEALDDQAAGKAADVFSLSLVLYEMLTGHPAVAGASPFEVMHKIANLPIPAPSSIRPDIDERLDDIVLKGLVKNREDRYPDARAMHRALLSYLQPDTGAPAVTNQRALDFVLMRMRVRSSFPALSQTISTINRIAASDDESMQTLTTALLKDFSLTNKLLRLVNSSTYGQFGGNISTISRAVMILGFNTVRNLAVTLILLEHLQNRHQAGELRSEVVRSLFNGIMTRRLLGPAGGGDPEEGFICGVFFNLGRLLAMYYLYDEWIEIGRRMHAGTSEHDAACAVLGLSLEELGTGVARSWNLPERMVRSMERIPASLPQTAGRDNLRIAANVGDMLCRIASHTGPDEKMRHLEDLVRRCRPRMQMTARDYASAVEEGVEKFNEEARLLINDHSRGPMLETIRIWSSGSATGETPATADAAPAADPVATALPAAADETEACTILTSGIQDITSTLVNGCSLNDVLRMVLETMYRGIGFDRVLLALRETGGTRFSGRFGFGSGNEGVVKAFCFDMRDHSDVFQLAAGKCVDLAIADSTVENIRARIPEWHHRLVCARSFIVLPLAIDKRCVGLLYGDRLKAGSPAIGTVSMGLLKTLRDQAVLAFRQR